MFKNMAKPNETIIEHTSFCYKIALDLCEIFNTEIKNLLDSKNISGKDLVLLSVLIHDLGKYAQPFQNKTLNSDYNGVWGYRHEIFSAEFVNLFPSLNNEEKKLLKLCILSHHNKTINQLEKAVYDEESKSFLVGISSSIIDEMNNNRKQCYEESKKSISEFQNEIFSEISKMLSVLNIPIDFKIKKLNNVFDLIKSYYKSVYNYENKYDYKKITFLKGLLVTADHLGSGHKKIISLNSNILEHYEKKFNIPNIGSFLSTQKKCINSNGESSVLIAPTGSGKTEASFLWVNENLKSNEYRRIFYILPYTASINAMFERLNDCDFLKNKIDLLHGKNTSYFYDLLTKNKTENEINENINNINKEVRLNKFTAKSFAKPIKVCTPHQIVKNFYGIKHFEESFIQYLNGLFIFDEIHCYDKVFLSELIYVMRTIKNTNKGKFLFMSATFPKVIENLIKKFIGINSETIQFEKKELKSFTKTKLNLINGKIEDLINIEIIQNKISCNERVLVICNTIKKAQLIFEKLICKNKILLHSAFNIDDRKNIESEIISGEKNDDKLQLLVGTQAIEVSLDLDYDCCFSEVASLDALVQRFGRVFRNRKRKRNEYGIVNVFREPDRASKFIYNEKINDIEYNTISKTLSELEKLDGHPLDYISLCNAIDRVFDTNYGNAIEKMIVEKIAVMKDNILIPMKDYSSEVEVYFKQFDGIKILPYEKKDMYENFIKEKRYIDADNLLVTLSERKLFLYYHQNFIYKMKIIGKNIFVTNENYIKYSHCKGLYLLDTMNEIFL